MPSFLGEQPAARARPATYPPWSSFSCCAPVIVFPEAYTFVSGARQRIIPSSTSSARRCSGWRASISSFAARVASSSPQRLVKARRRERARSTAEPASAASTPALVSRQALSRWRLRVQVGARFVEGLLHALQLLGRGLGRAQGDQFALGFARLALGGQRDRLVHLRFDAPVRRFGDQPDRPQCRQRQQPPAQAHRLALGRRARRRIDMHARRDRLRTRRGGSGRRRLGPRNRHRWRRCNMHLGSGGCRSHDRRAHRPLQRDACRRRDDRRCFRHGRRCGGVLPASPCAVPQYGQKFTRRGSACPHAAWMQRIMSCLAQPSCYCGSGTPSSGSGMDDGCAMPGMSATAPHLPDFGSCAMFQARVARSISPRASCCATSSSANGPRWAPPTNSL